VDESPPSDRTWKVKSGAAKGEREQKGRNEQPKREPLSGRDTTTKWWYYSRKSGERKREKDREVGPEPLDHTRRSTRLRLGYIA